MDFAKGDRVRLLGRPDWGAGKVLQNSHSGKVHVSFEYAGDKLLLLQYAKIFKVSKKPKAITNRSTEQGLHTPTLPT